MGKISKILISNRGEIAVRVIRTCREMGIKTVAIYSDVDRNCNHVKLADEAYCLGAAEPSQSYLNIEKIILVAKKSGADAIHPGYGFLSENAAFARAIETEGMIFIGPSAHSIEIMGDKLTAKKAVSDFDIPMVPGIDHAIDDIEDAKRIAEELGFPILIKASAGGGGKGMRVVHGNEEFEEQLGLAISEAKSAFGDGSVFIEKFITNPRHIEFQVFGDKQGNFLHFFERECSIQRRHQKVIEEAPSSVLSEDLREKMGKAAIEVAKACSYHGAGTVEFMLDGDMKFYFLEMNTRLQVEHPVTELITGKDLVKLQIQIAEGQKIPFEQKDLKIQGHSFELRVYAEDPLNNFLPDSGVLDSYDIPKGNGIRVDDGFSQGQEISISYDPLISKLVSNGENRKEAIEKMLRAISEYNIRGVETTLPFGTFVFNNQSFIDGDFDTNFVETHFYPSLKDEVPVDQMDKTALSIFSAWFHGQKEASGSFSIGKPTTSSWKKRYQS
jgi:acetyl-CoA carboxylase, biotin carboxylase subunit